MTLADVLHRVQGISDIRYDDESAHCDEDSLRHDVLAYYAAGGADPALAVEALKTDHIQFQRWCA
jgi:hypothetical protein